MVCGVVAGSVFADPPKSGSPNAPPNGMATAKAKASAAPTVVKPPHPQLVAMIQKGLSMIEQANKDLAVTKDEATKANAALKAANALVNKGRHAISEGQKLQKQGREAKKHGKDALGDEKIAKGQKAIDEGAKDVATGVVQVKGAEALLNAIHARAQKSRTQLEEGQKLVKTAEGQM